MRHFNPPEAKKSVTYQILGEIVTVDQEQDLEIVITTDVVISTTKAVNILKAVYPGKSISLTELKEL